MLSLYTLYNHIKIISYQGDNYLAITKNNFQCPSTRHQNLLNDSARSPWTGSSHLVLEIFIDFVRVARSPVPLSVSYYRVILRPTDYIINKTDALVTLSNMYKFSSFQEINFIIAQCSTQTRLAAIN